MWSIVNHACNLVFDVLLWPVQALPPLWQAAFLGLPGAVLGLLVYRYVSDQEGIEAAKDKIKAHLLELRLYRDDFRVSLRAQAGILRNNLTYLRHALLPLAVMIGPFLLMLIQVESRFAFRSLEPGETALLTVTLEADRVASDQPITLELPEGLAQDTPALRIDARGEVVWRLRGLQAGTHALGIRIGETQLSRRILVDVNGTPLAPEIYRADDWSTLLYPAERPLPSDAPAREVALAYPRALGTLVGLSSASWIFVGASVLFGFALRGLFGVTF